MSRPRPCARAALRTSAAAAVLAAAQRRSTARRQLPCSPAHFAAALPGAAGHCAPDRDAAAGAEMLAGTDKGERRRMQPNAEVATPLYAHQQEALAWMIERENSGRLPPFWGARRAPRPACMRGGRSRAGIPLGRGRA